ncbi:hypothetical protein D030_3813A, partial [Vibrio parahaemolyticus AQ3810]
MLLDEFTVKYRFATVSQCLAFPLQQEFR